MTGRSPRRPGEHRLTATSTSTRSWCRPSSHRLLSPTWEVLIAAAVLALMLLVAFLR
jgi:hypothetical protein